MNNFTLSSWFYNLTKINRVVSFPYTCCVQCVDVVSVVCCVWVNAPLQRLKFPGHLRACFTFNAITLCAQRVEGVLYIQWNREVAVKCSHVILKNILLINPYLWNVMTWFAFRGGRKRRHQRLMVVRFWKITPNTELVLSIVVPAF